MLQTVIMENSYQDSINLMLLSNKLSDMQGVNKVSIMMGTPANKTIFKGTGLYTPELEKAGPNDICIVIDSDSSEDASPNSQGNNIVDAVMAEVKEFLANLATKKSGTSIRVTRSWTSSMKALPDANLALISIPGVYAAEEAKKALDRGLNPFIFSDNVALEDEVNLKKYASEKGLIVMGPDCGTGILDGVPLAFANVVRKGNIGIVAASGTGLQEVSTIVHRSGYGVSHAIGTGGRDLSAEVGGITAIAGLKALAADDETKVIVLVSKPPAKVVRDKVVEVLRAIPKPVVAIFMGEKGGVPMQNITFASTLEQAGLMAVKALETLSPACELPKVNLEKVKASKGRHRIFGLYAGGTLAAEAAFILTEGFAGEESHNHIDGVYLELDGHRVIDFGDDKYTQGRPHPMIDSRYRVETLQELAENKDVSIIIFDLVLGYGGSMDMAGEMAKGIEHARAIASKDGREQIYIASMCGTDEDPQGYDDQKNKLLAAGVLIEDTNAQAVNRALTLFYQLTGDKQDITASEKVLDLLKNGPKVVNAGLSSFTDAIKKHGGTVVQFNWAPVAGGDARLAEILSKLV